MKTIMVPVDFSEYSEYALKVAASVAKNGKAEIITLHMLDIQNALMNESENYYQERTAFLLQLAKRNFKTFLKKDYLEGIKVVPVIKHFKIFSDINEFAKEENADMIIMGSHGATGFKELFFGSNTEKVIRTSEIPVFVIKNNPENFNFNTVVYATDFSKESIGAYLRMKAVVEDFKGEMHVIYVNTPYDDFKTTAEMQLAAGKFFEIAEGNGEKVKDVTFVSDKTVEKGIISYAKSVGADLISMSTHARKGWSHMINGSLTEDIANHTELPIMTVKI